MKPTLGRLHFGIIRLNDEIAKLGRVVPLLVDSPSSSTELADTDTVESYRDVTAIAVMSIRRLNEFFVPSAKRRKRDLAPDDFVPNWDHDHRALRNSREAETLRAYLRAAAKAEDRLTWNAALGETSAHYQGVEAARALILLAEHFVDALQRRDPELAAPLRAAIDEARSRISRAEILHETRASRPRDEVRAEARGLTVTRFDQATAREAR